MLLSSEDDLPVYSNAKPCAKKPPTPMTLYYFVTIRDVDVQFRLPSRCSMAFALLVYDAAGGWYATAGVSGGTLKVGTDMLFRIAGNQLPTYTTSHPGTALASISIYCKFQLPSP